MCGCVRKGQCLTGPLAHQPVGHACGITHLLYRPSHPCTALQYFWFCTPSCCRPLTRVPCLLYCPSLIHPLPPFCTALQYFWFRHAFLLGEEGTLRVLGMVCAMLADAKLEVREMAATTLSGKLNDVSAVGHAV